MVVALKSILIGIKEMGERNEEKLRQKGNRL